MSWARHRHELKRRLFKGWHYESARHSLAAKKIKTGRKKKIFSPLLKETKLIMKEYEFEPESDKDDILEKLDLYYSDDYINEIAVKIAKEKWGIDWDNLTDEQKDFVNDAAQEKVSKEENKMADLILKQL